MDMLADALPPRPTAQRRDDEEAAAQAWRAALHFYRLHSYHSSVSALRGLLPALVGYAAAGEASAGLLGANTAALVLLLMFCGAYDNYWDWRLLKERNGTSLVIEQWQIQPAVGLLLVVAPWVPLLGALQVARTQGMPWVSEAFFWLMAVLMACYVTPGPRLKDRPGSFLIAPLWAFLAFAQTATLNPEARWSDSMTALGAAVFLLQCQAELLHRLDDLLHGGSAAQIAVVLTRLRRLPLLSLAGSLAVGLRDPIFLNTAVWSVVRLVSLRRLIPEQTPVRRKQLWHPIWSLYEFLIYAVWGISQRVGGGGG